MRNLFRILGLGALMATCAFATDASAQKSRPVPLQEMRTGVPASTVVTSNLLKKGPTIVPVVDSNAILNLDYHEIRSAPAPIAKVAPVAPAVHEPTLAELKLQLRTAEDEYKASKLAYTQAARSKDNTRVATAKANRTAAAQRVTDLKKAVAAKQPVKAVKAKKRATPKKNSGGAPAASVSTNATK